MFSRRPIAGLLATLAVGAGGGAVAALAIDSGGNGAATTTSVATASPTMAVASSTSKVTVGDVYRRTKQGVVDVKAQSPQGTGEGSGFVLNKSGDIVTNQHVIDGASSVSVQFADGTRASASVVGSDRSSDVAVLHVSGVDAAKLTPLSFADSSKVAVGDGTIAIGSPYGLQGTVTVGVVSALNRTITSPNRYSIPGGIQTDAPINHGNSGGPLLDSTGGVIGMNAQIESNNGENTGVGFAIPSNTVRRVASDILGGTKVAHPFLGLSLTDGNGGALVGAVQSGGPADKAGVQQGDVVTAIDGTQVSSSSALISAVQAHKPGDSVALSLRRSGATHVVHVTLVNRAGS
jgi:putative serine protease PepD